ncbi:hypothetical protein A2333_01620 [Candidatus Wolfebacteria bacterium RIFOXYB2_FULL_49_7]|nr:MAG: hypothetical protein A2333_01620 [Candidatus Wolfebacteria bacterium RIFOXYB2_FULL_49_7]
MEVLSGKKAKETLKEFTTAISSKGCEGSWLEAAEAQFGEKMTLSGNLNQALYTFQEFAKDASRGDLRALPSYGWAMASFGRKPIQLSVRELSPTQIRRLLILGGSDYYFFPSGVKWLFVICHHEELHLYGKELIGFFRKKLRGDLRKSPPRR